MAEKAADQHRTAVEGDEPRGGATRTASVYEALREDLLGGRFAPEARLGISHLSLLYGTGATPIREVLNRLSAEGFVVQIDQRGFRVPSFSVEELQELTRTRCLINEITLREAIAHGSEHLDEEIVLAHHRLTRTPELLDGPGSRINPEWERRHRRFHSALIASCGSQWLIDMDAKLFEQSTRYRVLSANPAGSDRDSAAEHEAIMKAVLARDTVLAVKLLNDHIRQTADIAAQAPGGGDNS